MPYAFITADSPVMAMVLGMVGHSERFSCQLYCSLFGCCRERDGHYYPVMLKPNAYKVTSCDHNDIMFSDLKQYQQGIFVHYHDNLCKLLVANNPTQFKDRHLDTGLCKQTILSGLQSGLGILNIFPLDIMHLINLNNPDLLLGLWHGTIKIYLPNKIEL